MSKGYLGIDLGTYNSAVALSLEGSSEVAMLQTDSGLVAGGVLAFPSFLAFNARGEPQTDEFGEPARNKWRTFAGHVVWAFKRLLRRSYDDVAPHIARFRYKIEPDEDGWATAVVGPKKYRPEELYRLFLEWVRNCVTNPVLNPQVSGLDLERTIITVPAYYREDKVRATVEAARDAGLPDPHKLAEPVAAMLAYHETLRDADGQMVMCIDWGAGTLDIATGVVLAQGDDVCLEGLTAPLGDPALGGLDWDYALLEAVLKAARLEDLASLLEDYRTGALTVDAAQVLKVRALAGLHARVEDAKIDLSSMDVARIEIPGGDPIFLARRTADRDTLPEDRTLVFEQILEQAGILPRFEKCLDAALDEIGGPEAVGRLVLVGGPCCSPVVWGIVRRKFAGTPAEEDIKSIQENGFRVSPMEAVARGAAMFAAEPETHESADNIVPHDYGFVFELTDADLENAARRIAADHGVQADPAILEMIKRNLREVARPVGMVCIERNAQVGTRVTKGISRLGAPGEHMRIAPFAQMHDPDGLRREAYGGFDLVPTYRNGRAGVEITIEYTRDQGLVIGVTDEHTGASFELRNVDRIAPHPIPEPVEPSNAGGGGGGMPMQVGDRVPVDVFNRWRERCQALIGLAHRFSPPGTDRLVSELEAAIQKCQASRDSEGIDQEAFTPMTMIFNELKNALLQAGVKQADKI